MKTEIKVGCIGCGGRGKLYSSSINKISDFKMWAYADKFGEKAQAFLNEYGGNYATSDVERVLTDPDIDVVFICTHHDTHHPFVVKAAQNEKHILVEKPMAMTIEECQDIEKEVNEAGVTLACGFKMRFMPMVKMAREVIGNPLMIVGQMMDNRWGDTSWAQQPKMGGGNVISQGCHTADLLCYFAGADPVKVHAAGGTMTHENTDIIDNVVATVEFENGTVASMIQGDAGHNPFASKFFFELFSKDGRGVCLYNRCHDAHYWGVKELGHITAETYSEETKIDPEGDFLLLKHFCESVLEGKQTIVGPREGRIATTLILKIFDSIRSGKTQHMALS
ncbi:Gfo/Idh/MocA family oxidoreductase [bacterium]|nr:Gfo/Idh/MocA family oxidoreductase [bacterium]